MVALFVVGWRTAPYRSIKDFKHNPAIALHLLQERQSNIVRDYAYSQGRYQIVLAILAISSSPPLS